MAVDAHAILAIELMAENSSFILGCWRMALVAKTLVACGQTIRESLHLRGPLPNHRNIAETADAQIAEMLTFKFVSLFLSRQAAFAFVTGTMLAELTPIRRLGSRTHRNIRCDRNFAPTTTTGLTELLRVSVEERLLSNVNFTYRTHAILTHISTIEGARFGQVDSSLLVQWFSAIVICAKAFRTI